MGQPVVVPRAEHAISRSQIDPDALKVLYRLHQNNYLAYLVGGSVRDLLLERRPKDFDIGTSAHPYQVKRLFRNCWIIGRRFRLAHVRFGTKNIEVATFRRQLSAEELAAPPEPPPDDSIPLHPDGSRAHDGMLHRDNTFGTPEEDAFRRDFTVNALFYDIASFSIIDYTGGLRDLEGRLIRCIGNPVERFQEDPVRMLRAGASERAFRMLAERRLLEPITPELQKGAGEALWRSLAELDAYRHRFEDTPETLTNSILLGSLLVPIGHTIRSLSPAPVAEGEFRREPRLSLGMLPLARRDVERLRQILGLQRRLTDMNLSPKARRALTHRGPFREALTWLEIHGNAPDVVEHWRGFIEAAGAFEDGPDAAAEGPPPKRRRRRRRRRTPRSTTT